MRVLYMCGRHSTCPVRSQCANHDDFLCTHTCVSIIYTHVYLSRYTHVCVYICEEAVRTSQQHIHAYTHVYTSRYTHVHTYVHIYVRAYIYAYVCVYICADALSVTWGASRYTFMCAVTCAVTDASYVCHEPFTCVLVAIPVIWGASHYTFICVPWRVPWLMHHMCATNHSHVY